MTAWITEEPKATGKYLVAFKIAVSENGRFVREDKEYGVCTFQAQNETGDSPIEGWAVPPGIIVEAHQEIIPFTNVL
jgi:hypothetical protein